jgi:hypothetical protein
MEKQRRGDGIYTRPEETERNKSASKANEGGKQTEELVQLCNWMEKRQQ